MVISLERGADLHTAQLTPLPLTVSCFSKIPIGFTFLVPAHLGSPGKGPLNVCLWGDRRKEASMHSDPDGFRSLLSSRFDTTPACDEQTEGHTTTAYRR